MTRIVSFDPGQTTGVVVIDVDDDGRDFSVHRCDEIPWEARFANIDYIFIEDAPHIVVVERFRLYPHKAQAQIGSDFPSAQVIGIIGTFCYAHGPTPENIFFQGAGDITKVMVLERDLRWVAGSPHKIDAYRHARLHFLKHFYLNPFES